MKKIGALLLSLLVILSTITPTIVQAIGESSNVSTTIKAKVKITDDKLKGKKFKFALYGESITDSPLQVVESDTNGDITFSPVQFERPGEYKFKVVQQELQDESNNLIYDKAEKEVTVRLTKEDFKEIQQNKKYYGTAPPRGHIIMGETIGGNDFQVFCIDNTKLLPPSTPTSKEYTAITDPDYDTLKGMVTHNLWGTELPTVLKKIFFFFQAHPNRFDVDTQHNIVWAATGAYGDTQESMAQYGDYMEEINKVTLPDEYHLVVFRPVIAHIPTNTDGLGNPDESDLPSMSGVRYQDLAMGHGASIENTTIPDKPTAEVPVFVNSIKEDPVKPTPNEIELLIKKISKSTGNQLNGAKLALFKGEGTLGKKVKDINTTEVAEKIKLENGVYTLSEIVAPDGYRKAEDIIFKIEESKLYLKEDGSFKEYENYEEVDSNKYEAFSDRNDDSFQWQFTPYGKHYYLKENGGKGQVLYCFNIDKHEPVESYDNGANIDYNPFDGGEVKYTKVLNPIGLIGNAQNPRIKDPQKFHETIRKVIYAGYPNKNAGIGNDLSDTTFKAVTQLAIYYFTDSIDINNVEHGFEGIRSPENKEIMQAYKDLVAYAENQQIKIPDDFKLNIYKSNNGNYQNLIGTKYNPEGLLYTITMIDEEAPKVTEKEVTFSKTEVNGTKELEGASLKVVEGEEVTGKLVEEWTSTKDQKKITLKEGIYTMIETQAPNGYEIAENITFKVTHEGKIEIKQKDGQYKVIENSTVKMEDALKQIPLFPAETKVKVQKVWENTEEKAQKEITVELYKNGQTTGKTIKLNGNNNWQGEFTGLKTVDKIDQETPNNYTIKEVGETDGQIEIAGNIFKVTVTGTAKEGYTVKNTYKPTEKEVTFSKIEVNGTKELEGASLKVVEGEGVTGKLVEEWTSTKDQKNITLKEGIYTMIETQAPNGYEIAENITFKVTHEGKIEIKQKDGQYKAIENSTVKMEDALKPVDNNHKQEPGISNTNKNEDIKNNKLSQTGEVTNVTMYIGMMILSVVLLIFVNFRRIKNNSN